MLTFNVRKSPSSPVVLSGEFAVLTPSEWVRGTVIERFDVDPDLVVSVPHGMPPLDEGTPLDDLRRRFDIPGDLVVYPTITYPHKDHVTLIRAFQRLASAHPDVTLVLPGGAAGAEDDVRSAIAASGVAPRIRRLGHLLRSHQGQFSFPLH